MVNLQHLVSITALFAVPAAISQFEFGSLSFFARIAERFKKGRKNVLAPAPKVLTENGWTTIYCDDLDSFEKWLGKDELGLPHGENEVPSLGSHLLIELFGCESGFLQYEETVGQIMNQAAVESKATVVAQSFHEFKPFGVSGAVIIQESHYTIHTWPEHQYAAVDLFYCGGTVEVTKAVQVLQQRFQPDRIKFLIVRRGLQSEVGNP